MLAHARRLSTRVSAPHSALARAALAPASQRLFTGLSPLSSPQSSRQSLLSTPRAPLSLRVCAIPSAPLLAPFAPLHMRFYSRRSDRNPWESGGGSGDWMSTVKTGALLAVGAGAVVAAASVGFGFIVFGAAGYGLYRLYQRFFAPYRSNDPFGSVQADIDRIFNQSRQRSRSGTTARSASPAGTDQDLDSLVQGLPFMVRGLVKTLFSFAGSAMKSSMARAGELRRLANDAMRANTAIVSQMGNDVSISTPQNWMEYTVNGAGRVEAVFPVVGDGYAQAQVTAKASVGVNGELTLQELKYRNQRTGEVIDLLRDGGSAASARRKRVVEAEYVDLDDRT